MEFEHYISQATKIRAFITIGLQLPQVTWSSNVEIRIILVFTHILAKTSLWNLGPKKFGCPNNQLHRRSCGKMSLLDIEVA